MSTPEQEAVEVDWEQRYLDEVARNVRARTAQDEKIRKARQDKSAAEAKVADLEAQVRKLSPTAWEQRKAANEEAERVQQAERMTARNAELYADNVKLRKIISRGHRAIIEQHIATLQQSLRHYSTPAQELTGEVPELP